jgi:di/tricarboxylate transporter
MMGFDFWYTSVVVIIMTIFLLKEWLEMDLVIFSSLILLILGRVVTIKQALSGFSNEGMISIALLFIIAGGLYNSGALNDFTRFMFSTKNMSQTARLGRFLFPITGLSAFMNNTPIIAIMIPPLRNWVERMSLAPGKYFIPLSYASIFGGMCTLIGTSTNLIIYGLMVDYGMTGLGMFEISKIGIPVAISGVLYIMYIGHRLLPENKVSMDSIGRDSREYVIELQVSEGYSGIGKTVEEAGLRHLKGLFLFQIERQGDIITLASPHQKIHLRDRLYFTGLPKTILELQKTAGLQLMQDSSFDLKQYNSSEIKPFEAVISPSSPLIGQNVRESNFRDNYGAVIIAIHRNGSRINQKVGDIELRPGDTLLLLADRGFHKQWYHSKDFYLISEADPVPSRPRWHGYFAVSVLVLMVLTIVMRWLPMVTSAGLATIALILTRTISPEEARNAIDGRVLLMIASAFGIAEALTNSGVADFVAQGIIGLTRHLGSVAVVAGFFIVTSIYTNIITNNAAAAIIFPIAFATAQQMNMDPRPFIMALTIGASASFATPISYQTNMMVYGPGGYKFNDYLKVGLPLQLIIAVIAVTLIYFFYL